MADKTIAEERATLAWHAVAQASALMGTLERELDRDETEAGFVVPTLIRRINELHGVLVDVLDPSDLTIEQMRAIVHGEKQAEAVDG